jgi:hypothetical protein
MQILVVKIKFRNSGIYFPEKGSEAGIFFISSCMFDNLN